MLYDQKVVDDLQSKINKIASEQRLVLNYNTWRTNTISYLKMIFGEEHHKIEDFGNISEASLLFVDSENYAFIYNSSKDKSIGFLNSLIEEVKNYGLSQVIGINMKQHSVTDRSISISNNLHQSEHQSQSISFEILLDVIKTELDESQIEELKKVLSEYKSTNNFSKVVKYCFNLGENVLANILANVILNPSIVTTLIQKL